jgi:hypothetical protein
MATYTQLGSITIDAFQWNDGALSTYNLPIWAKRLALQQSGSTLCVPVGVAKGNGGVLPANPTDWVYLAPDGSVHVVTNAYFVSLYH